MKRLILSLTSLLLCAGAASADIAPSRPAPRPEPRQAGRDPVGQARRDPAIAAQLEAARKGNPEETAAQVVLGGQCGFAGCSSTSLAVFTFRSKGANTATRTVLALVECGPVGDACKVSPAEVRSVSPAAPPPPSAPPTPGTTPPPTKAPKDR